MEKEEENIFGRWKGEREKEKDSKMVTPQKARAARQRGVTSLEGRRREEEEEGRNHLNPKKLSFYNVRRENFSEREGERERKPHKDALQVMGPDVAR